MRKLRNQGSLGCARSCFSYNNETPFNSSCMSKYITNAICVLNFPLSWNADFNILRRERYFSTGSLSSQYELFVLLLCSRIKAFYMNNSDSDPHFSFTVFISLLFIFRFFAHEIFGFFPQERHFYAATITKGNMATYIEPV